MPSPPTLANTEESDLQKWLYSLLAEHRESLSNEIAKHFDAYRTITKKDANELGSSLHALVTQATQGALKQRPIKKQAVQAGANEISISDRPPLETAPSPPLIASSDERVNIQDERSRSVSPSTKQTESQHRVVDHAVGNVANDSFTHGLQENPTCGSDTTHQKVQDVLPGSRTLLIRTKAAWYTTRIDYFFTFVVIMNLMVLILEMEYQSHRSEQILKEGEAALDDWHTLFRILEHTFNGIFIVEGCVRIYLDRCYYFHVPMNCMDFFLVSFTSFQLYCLEPAGVNFGENFTIIRVLRMAKFVRVLKVMRLAMFADLRVLVFTCLSSLSSLFWSMVLLFIIMFIMALVMCNLLKASIQDSTLDHSFRNWLYIHYGSVLHSSYTIFEITMAGCWPTYFRPLVDRISGWFGVVALAYISVVVFAVIRIITALFLKETLKVASSDVEMQVNEIRAQTQRNATKLRRVFVALDREGDGTLSNDEFNAITTLPEVGALLQSFDLQMHDIQGLFHLLDNGDGKITFDEFIQGVLRLKGQARSLDVVALGRACDKMERLLGDLLERFACIEGKLLYIV